MNRFKVKSYFAKPKFCGIRFNKTKFYTVIDTLRNDCEVAFDFRWNEETANKRCAWLNANIVAPLYKVFKNGLDKYLICYKMKYHSTSEFCDGLIWYSRICHLDEDIDPLDDINWIPEVGEFKIHISSCNFFSADILRNGVDSLEEACEMLTLVIEKHDEIEEIQKQWRSKREKEKTAIPINCI